MAYRLPFQVSLSTSLQGGRPSFESHLTARLEASHSNH